MNPDSDSIKWVITKDDYSTASILNEIQKLPEPKYSAFGERIRHVAPTAMQCSMFCGGKQCKYCNPAKFKKEPNQDAINGLYSAWVTSNILATSRPSTTAIKQYNIIEQFQKKEIRSIINLQHPGEHAACGFGLEAGGFTYVPQDFMDNDVFFYNFGWNDYGVRSLQSILDMVKVFDFALSKGKAAVHCHAGLGRTGVLIACYLIYSMRLTSHEAIMKVREARPKAIQTRGQIYCVNDFASYIKPMWKIFSDDEDVIMYTFTLKQFMNRQRNLLHGEEARTLRFVPKIVYAICSRLLVLADIEFDLSKSAIVTHFGFMKNAPICNKNNQANEDESNASTNDDSLDVMTKTQFPVEEEPFAGSSGAEDEPKEHTYHSDEEVLEDHHPKLKRQEDDSDEPRLDQQFKAHSSPNVASSDCHDQQNDILNRTFTGSTSKKGAIHLEPIAPRKTKRKKKKGLQDRMKELNAIEERNNKGESNDDFLNTSLPPVLKDVQIKKRQKNGYKQKKNVFKPDQISLASFSSMANEGLCEDEIVFKHLAFRTSDLTVSTSIERYKRKLNNEDLAWDQIGQENNIAVLTGLLWSWFSQLQSPVVTEEVLGILNENIETHENAADHIDRDIWKMVKFFIVFLSKLNGTKEYEDRVLRRFSVIVTNDDFSKDTIERDVSIQDASPGLQFFKFVSSWLQSMK